jgi:cell wall-associated NlpC family hydrolase
VVDNGLPTSYAIPNDATAAETVAITYAFAQLGKPYLWGGVGPNAFDCSGLTMMAWTQAGVTLLHYTGDQITEGTRVSSYADISPGDLVLVPGSDGTVANPGHVGLYLGEGLVESAVDVQYGVIVQSYSSFVSAGLSGIRHVG